jgi:hypothetical protein
MKSKKRTTRKAKKTRKNAKNWCVNMYTIW